MSPEDTEKARALRLSGLSWSDVAEAIGRNTDTVRIALDPAFAQRRREADRKRAAKRREAERVVNGVHTDGYRAPDPATTARALAAIPTDTRSMFSRFMGDPLPGRSALDRRAGH